MAPPFFRLTADGALPDRLLEASWAVKHKVEPEPGGTAEIKLLQEQFSTHEVTNATLHATSVLDHLKPLSAVSLPGETGETY